ncbi:MAG: hypothetical protein PHR23_06695 [bacterium]|jgi:Ca2+/Na+ antiporter|nr:hypothetical protein [bacterium]
MDKEKKTQIIIPISLIAMFISGIIGLYILLKVVPDYTFRYTVIGVLLPLPTTICISLSHFIRECFLLLLPIIVLSLAVAIALPFIMKNKNILAKVYVIITCIFILLVVFYVFALEIPMVKTRNMIMKLEGISSEEADKKIDKIIDEAHKKYKYR